eukprot:3485978-Amphidinium_carterae.1
MARENAKRLTDSLDGTRTTPPPPGLPAIIPPLVKRASTGAYQTCDNLKVSMEDAAERLFWGNDNPECELLAQLWLFLLVALDQCGAESLKLQRILQTKPEMRLGFFRVGLQQGK